MQYRQIGNSDLNVSEIALGSWLTYGVAINENTSRECLATAFDCGINFIDTANVYANGAAESFLGEELAGRPRDSYVLATKLFFPMYDTDYVLSAFQIHKQLEDSLRRLRTDHIDLYQLHWPNRGSYHFRQNWRYDPGTQNTQQTLDHIAVSRWFLQGLGATITNQPVIACLELIPFGVTAKIIVVVQDQNACLRMLFLIKMCSRKTAYACPDNNKIVYSGIRLKHRAPVTFTATSQLVADFVRPRMIATQAG